MRTEHLQTQDVRRAIQGLNWTGKEAPVELPKGPDKPLVPVRKPIKDILSILLIQIDTDDPSESRIFVRLVTPPPPPRTPEMTLSTGDKLPSPNEYIEVGKIGVEGVEFVYDDGEIEKLNPAGLGGAPLVVGLDESGVRYPLESGGIEIPKVEGNPFRPTETTLFRQNHYVLGTEDTAYLAENYPAVLTNDLRYKTHVDPNTGRRDGIEIQTVRPGSIAERHGAQPGDILKSINGHPVSSDQEAMSFVRNNQDKYTSWEVEILRLGRTVTLTFQNPR